MSRLYRAVKNEALADVIVTDPQRLETIWRLESEKGYGAHSHFSTFSAKDERSFRGTFVDPITHKHLPDRHDFIVFNGQGVNHPDWGWGVVQEESDDGRDCTVLFFDEVVTVSRQSLERISYKTEVGDVVFVESLTEEDEAQFAECPKCRKVKLLETVDSEGDKHANCYGGSCTFTQVWRRKVEVAPMAQEVEAELVGAV